MVQEFENDNGLGGVFSTALHNRKPSAEQAVIGPNHKRVNTNKDRRNETSREGFVKEFESKSESKEPNPDSALRESELRFREQLAELERWWS